MEILKETRDNNKTFSKSVFLFNALRCITARMTMQTDVNDAIKR